jgi:hypothetical protein
MVVFFGNSAPCTGPVPTHFHGGSHVRYATRALVLALLAAGASPAQAETPVTTGGESFQLNGYSSFEFEKQLSKTGEGDKNGSFDADLFDLVLNWRASEHLRVAADMTWEHGSAIEDGRGNVALEYGWVEYAVSDALRFRAGKMFTPFGIYNEIHTAKPATLTVKEPFSTNRTDKWGTALRLYPRWQVGVGFFGNGTAAIGDWDYALTVSNGEQYKYDGGFDVTGNPYEEDSNKEKAITARVRLATIGNLELGLSGYYDTVVVTDASTGDPFPGTLRQVAYGLSLKWTLPAPAIGVELEFMGSDFTPTTALKNAVVAATYDPLDTATTKGASAMVFWRATEALTPYVRFELLDLDDDREADRTSLLLAGVNYRVGDGLVLKVEGDYTMAQKNAKFGDGVDGMKFLEVKVAAVVGF